MHTCIFYITHTYIYMCICLSLYVYIYVYIYTRILLCVIVPDPSAKASANCVLDILRRKLWRCCTSMALRKAEGHSEVPHFQGIKHGSGYGPELILRGRWDIAALPGQFPERCSAALWSFLTFVAASWAHSRGISNERIHSLRLRWQLWMPLTVNPWPCLATFRDRDFVPVRVPLRQQRNLAPPSTKEMGLNEQIAVCSSLQGSGCVLAVCPGMLLSLRGVGERMGEEINKHAQPASLPKLVRVC